MLLCLRDDLNNVSPAIPETRAPGNTSGAQSQFPPRFMLEVPSADVRLRIDGRRVIDVHTDHQAMISNTCAYEPAFEGRSGHFYAHYLTVEAQRRPTVRGTAALPRAAFAAFSVPSDPAQCWPAFVEIR